MRFVFFLIILVFSFPHLDESNHLLFCFGHCFLLPLFVYKTSFLCLAHWSTYIYPVE
jgi:hypothetical protein